MDKTIYVLMCDEDNLQYDIEGASTLEGLQNIISDVKSALGDSKSLDHLTYYLSSTSTTTAYGLEQFKIGVSEKVHDGYIINWNSQLINRFLEGEFE